MLPQDQPLSRFRALDTRSPDEAREVVGRIFCPHFLHPAEARPCRFHARHNSARQAGYSVNYVGYGSTVEIDPGELSRFFLVQLPLRGAAQVRCGGVAVDVSAGRQASILSPTLPTRMIWHTGCEKIIILLDRNRVEDQFAALGSHAVRPIEFPTGIDLMTSVGNAISRHVGLIVATADEDTAVPEAYQTTLRDGLTTLLLTGLAHSGSHLLRQPDSMPAPRAVRSAEAFIEAHLDGPMAMADVARAAGLCLRSLQQAFRQRRGMTLSEWIQTRRLERFRIALLKAEAPASVTELALATGLGHTGRAAAAYRARYGETPSQTLRRH